MATVRAAFWLFSSAAPTSSSASSSSAHPVSNWRHGVHILAFSRSSAWPCLRSSDSDSACHPSLLCWSAVSDFPWPGSKLPRRNAGKHASALRARSVPASSRRCETECNVNAGDKEVPLGYTNEDVIAGGVGGLLDDSKSSWLARGSGPFEEQEVARRQALAGVLLGSVGVVLLLPAGKVSAEEVEKGGVEDKDQSIIGGLLSIFDPNETTKLGKRLPKAYLKSAREVVQTLRESFNEESDQEAKFRRNADSAKSAIREYISNWRGVDLVAAEESYRAIERALRVLGEFYNKKGPLAALPKDVRVRVLGDLQLADDAL